MHTIVYVEIFIYLLAMLGVGIYFSKKDLSHNDYFLGEINYLAGR